MARRSHYKVSGRAGASRTTTYTLSGTIPPGLAALIATDFVAAWQEEMEARSGPPAKGEPRIRPQKVVLTINL